MNRLQHNPIGTELLDDPAADDAQVRESLRNIARANRWFGGTWAVRWAMHEVLRALPSASPLVLLDAGAGAGDLARAAVAVARTHGVALSVVCLDRHFAAAKLAAGAGRLALQADAGALPLADRSVDIVLLSQLVHHFDPASVASLLRESARVARRAVVVADLRRSRMASVLFRIGSHAMGFDRVTIHDGLTSLQRAYTAVELVELLRRAGLAPRVRRRPGWRLVAIALVPP